VSGFTVPSGNAQLLAEKMLQLLSDDELRQSMGRAARQRILSCATIEICARQIMNIYQTILHEESAVDVSLI
jgi:glycosyltransferase involved in cell wall biosynthesis